MYLPSNIECTSHILISMCTANVLSIFDQYGPIPAVLNSTQLLKLIVYLRYTATWCTPKALQMVIGYKSFAREM